MTLQLRYVSHSEIGLVRKNNQDSGFASPHLLVVADGMGGAAAGDLASAVTIDTIRRIDAPITGRQMLEVLAGAIHKANDRIADLVEVDPSLEGMGTTVTGAMFDGHELGLAHIGDSRAYLLREGRLERLTHDHSWVQSLVDEGKISPDEATYHPHRSLLLKVLNGQSANDPDLTMVSVAVGDRLLFCSDGVCGLLDDPVIERALCLPGLEEAMERLIREALAEGGIDNITVIVADVIEAAGPGAAGPGAAASETVSILGAASERHIPSADTLTRVGVGVGADGHTARNTDGAAHPEPPAAGAGGPDHADEARYNPQAPARGRFIRPLIGLVVLVLVAAAGLGIAYSWTRTQYFVGVAGAQVAIYQGLSEAIPGLQLSQVHELQPLAVADLPPFYQDKVRANIDVSSLDSARKTVAELTEAARRCAAQRPAGRPSAAPSPVPEAPKASVPLTPSATAPESSC